MTISTSERNRIRTLATRVFEAATRPEMESIKKRWRAVNALRRPDRAPVWCKPIGAWSEIIPDSMLQCTTRWLREMEMQFLRHLHKVEVGDDSIVPSFHEVPAVFKVSPANIWGVDIKHITTQDKGGAWGYNPPLVTENDFDRLVMPSWTFDRETTERKMAEVEELIGDILPVRMQCGPGYDSATLGAIAAELRGLEQLMVDMIDQPGLTHRLMAYLRDARLRLLETWESTGLVTANNEDAMLCSDPVGSPSGGRTTLANCWCAGNSQEFDMVSPDMFEEFCLNYQKPIFAKFGYSCYGCCENLGQKIPQVLTIPNLRIFVCSAWTTLTVALEHVPEQYCIMWRQKASDIVFPQDMSTIDADLMDGAKRLQGRPYQIVLRELQTLSGHPDRLHQWTRSAIAAAEKYA